jgi:hypothetical protein
MIAGLTTGGIGGAALLVFAVPAALTFVEAGQQDQEPCGGLAGIECQDPGDFCKLPIGECCCDVPGVCTPRPFGCPDVYDPVCGCDDITYSNECDAAAAGVSIAYLGECGQACGGIAGEECPEGEYCRFRDGECCCDQVGVCRPIPGACPNECEPVCGCDGVTYTNACHAAAAEASIDHPGPCFEGGQLIGRVRFDSPQKLRWALDPDALSYNVYVKRVLEQPPLDYGECLIADVIASETAVPGAPETRRLWLVQVTGNFLDGEGPMGTTWTCSRRQPSAPCSSSPSSTAKTKR